MNKQEHNKLSDEELLKLYYSSGDNELLGLLLQRYTLLLFGVSMKYLKQEDKAKDAVQQIFIKVISEISKYRVTYFKSWLYTITKNYCLSVLRSSNKVLYNILPEKVYTETPTEEEISKSNLIDYTESALQELSEQQRTCIIMFYLHNKTYQQISESTNFSLLQVKSFIQNGKRNLKIAIEKKIKQTVNEWLFQNMAKGKQG